MLKKCRSNFKGNSGICSFWAPWYFKNGKSYNISVHIYSRQNFFWGIQWKKTAYILSGATTPLNNYNLHLVPSIFVLKFQKNRSTKTSYCEETKPLHLQTHTIIQPWSYKNISIKFMTRENITLPLKNKTNIMSGPASLQNIPVMYAFFTPVLNVGMLRSSVERTKWLSFRLHILGIAHVIEW